MSEQDVGEKPAEEEPVEPKIVLTQENIEQGLSNLQRTPDGASYAFASLTLDEKDPALQDLIDVNPGPNNNQCVLDKYQLLRFVSLNKNALQNIDKVKQLPYLYELSARGNQIQDIDFLCDQRGSLKFLQKVDLAENKIKKLPQIVAPSLFQLILDENEISECEIKKHTALKVLKLNKNKLTSCAGIQGLSALEELSIAENETLTTLKGLEDLPSLKKLILNGSKIDSLDDFPNLPSLEELNLDGNAISKLAQLKNLTKLQNLRELSLAGTPLAEEKGDDLRKEILIALLDKNKKLKKINGEGWDEEIAKEAREERANRIKAEQEAQNAPKEENAGEQPPEDE